MISASNGRVLNTRRVSGITRLTNRSRLPRTWGTETVISPSAVWTRLGRTPFREPLAVGFRSYRARPRKAATSSSSARWRMSWAPSRPTSASRSASPIPSASNLSIPSSIWALGAILCMGVGSAFGSLLSTSGVYALSFYSIRRTPSFLISTSRLSIFFFPEREHGPRWAGGSTPLCNITSRRVNLSRQLFSRTAGSLGMTATHTS